MIAAKVKNIVAHDGVSMVKFSRNELTLNMLALGTLPNLKISDGVRLGFKSADVIVATVPLAACSLSNEIRAKILNLTCGQITAVLHLRSLDLDVNFEFESIISAASCDRLGLKPDDQIYAYIKATALFISDFGETNE